MHQQHGMKLFRKASRWVRMAWFGTLAVLAANAIAADAPGRDRFQDATGWAGRFDGPSRDQWQKPDEVIRALALPRDAVVADVGSGTGYFAVRLARAVPQGRVYGADVEPAMVSHLQQRATEENLANLKAIQATRESPALPEPVDLALFVNVQGLMVNPRDYFQRLRAALKPGGRVAIIATRTDSPFGAPAAMRVPAAQITRDMMQQGYAVVAEHDFLPYQYFLVFQPREPR
jgi:cyclopropane fatty-acyl-phospholipid synthase-like methyltransferase